MRPTNFSLPLHWLIPLICVRLLAAFVAPILDGADETFNYWEPLSFVASGRGFQTWEYAPEYGMRSYLYILCYAWLPSILKSHVPPKCLFYAVRIMIALFGVG